MIEEPQLFGTTAFKTANYGLLVMVLLFIGLAVKVLFIKQNKAFLFVWIPIIFLIPLAVLMSAAWIDVSFSLTQTSGEVFVYFCLFILLSHIFWAMLGIVRLLIRASYNFVIEEVGTWILLLALFFLFSQPLIESGQGHTFTSSFQKYCPVPISLTVAFFWALICFKTLFKYDLQSVSPIPRCQKCYALISKISKYAVIIETTLSLAVGQLVLWIDFISFESTYRPSFIFRLLLHPLFLFTLSFLHQLKTGPKFLFIGFIGANLNSIILAGMLDLNSQNYKFVSWDFLSLFVIFQFYSFLHYLQRKRPGLYLTAITLFDLLMMFPLNSFTTKTEIRHIGTSSAEDARRLRFKIFGLVTFFLSAIAITSQISFLYFKGCKRRRFCGLSYSYKRASIFIITLCFHAALGLSIYLEHNANYEDKTAALCFTLGNFIFFNYLYLCSFLMLNQRIHLPQVLKDKIQTLTYFDLFSKNLLKKYSRYDIEIIRGRQEKLRFALILNIFAASLVLPVLILVLIFFFVIFDIIRTSEGQHTLLVFAYLHIASIVVVILIKIRLAFGPFALYGFALTVLFLWLLLLFPFFSVIPFVYYLWQTTFARSALFHGSVILFALDMIFLTSIVSAMLHKSYQRMRIEEESKRTGKRLKAMLRFYKIKSDSETLRTLYDLFLREGERRVHERLMAENEEERVLHLLELGEHDPYEQYSAALVLKEEHERIINRERKFLKKLSLLEEKIIKWRARRIEVFHKLREKHQMELEQLFIRKERIMLEVEHRTCKQRCALFRGRLGRSICMSSRRQKEVLNESNEANQDLEEEIQNHIYDRHIRKRREKVLVTFKLITPLHYRMQTALKRLKQGRYDINSIALLIETSYRVAQSLVELMFHRFSYELGPVSTASVFIASGNKAVGAFIKRHTTIRGFQHQLNQGVQQVKGDTSDNLLEFDESLSFKSSISDEFGDNDEENKEEEEKKHFIGRQDISFLFDEIQQSGILPRNKQKLRAQKPHINYPQFREMLEEASLQINMPFPNQAINFRLFLKHFYQFIVEFDPFYTEEWVLQRLREVGEQHFLQIVNKELREQKIKAQKRAQNTCSHKCNQRFKRCFVKGCLLKIGRCLRAGVRALFDCYRRADGAQQVQPQEQKEEQDEEQDYSYLKEDDMERMMLEDEAKILQKVENYVPSTLKKMRKVYHHPKLVVEWPKLVELIMKKLRRHDSSSKIILRFRWKKNCLTFLAKIVEYWTLITFIFTDELQWNFQDWSYAILQSANLSMPISLQIFPILFFFCVFFTLFYLLLLPSVAKKSRQGILGLNPKTLTQANVCSCAYFHLGLVKIFSIALYTGIVVNLMGVFSCDFLANSAPVLHQHPTWQCFTAFHITLMTIAFCCLLIYYPAATIVFPNIQYASKAVELKYEEDFLVYLAQVKLVIAGMSLFLISGGWIFVRLVITIALLLSLAFYSY